MADLCRVHLLRSLVACAVVAGCSSPHSTVLSGCTADTSARLRRAEQRLSASLDATRIERDLRELTREPHPAGSQRNDELAHFVADAFRAAGLAEVEEVAYDVLMSYPREIVVEEIGPAFHRATIAEDVIGEDPDTENPHLGLPYHAFSASGEITAELVYARNGNPEDYAYLASRGVDVRGKLVLVRPSVPYSYRGFKALTAQRLGVAGLLIYSDPKDDGFAKGAVYPAGPWGSEGHIQRGAITFDFLVPGDPLTPGWPSLPGERRIAIDEAVSVPRILSTPITAHDARVLLASLGGEEAPPEWRGALPVTYRLGPGPCTVHMKLDLPRPVTKIVNVLARIPGHAEPDSIVLLGNHRDAWVFGAYDPASGTAALLELARALGSLAKDGWRPRRTIVLASWDAEEFALTGSTEWGEEHLEDLKRHLVAYLNLDSAASGSSFSASASASLAPLIEGVIGDVVDPASGRSVREKWIEGKAGGGTIAIAAGGGKVQPIGSGSDHTVFLNLVGAPAADMTFEGDYGVYHSAYDSFRWMTRFGDPGMRYARTIAEIWGRLALRLSCADLLPIDDGVYGHEIGTYLDALHLENGADTDVQKRENASTAFSSGADAADVRELRAAIERFTSAGKRLAALQRDPSAIEKLSTDARATVNAELMQAERELCDPAGLPDRPWFKHLVYACRYTYLPLVLPGLTEAVEAKDAAAIAVRCHILSQALARARERLERAAAVAAR